MTDTHCIAVSFDPEVHTADNHRLKVGYASRYPDYSRLASYVISGSGKLKRLCTVTTTRYCSSIKTYSGLWDRRDTAACGT